MLIVFPLQQCLHERASMLRYTYFACIVNSKFAGKFLNNSKYLFVISHYFQ